MNQLFIAPKIKVGTQQRDDTYTKTLAFLTYETPEGKVNQEKSWTSWRQKDLGDFENTPTEGFVLNKGVGTSGGRSQRRSKIRVYDPRGWEIEITVENLMFILDQNNCIAGKGIEGEFVYAWAPGGRQLWLLPTKVAEYKGCKEYTALQYNKEIGLKDLIVGATYKTKYDSTITYLGRHDYNERGYGVYVLKTSRAHVFLNEHGSFETLRNTKSLSLCVREECHPDFAHMMDCYEMSILNQTPKSFIEITGGLTKKDLPKRGTRKSLFAPMDGGYNNYELEQNGDNSYNPEGYHLVLNNRYFFDESGLLQKKYVRSRENDDNLCYEDNLEAWNGRSSKTYNSIEEINEAGLIKLNFLSTKEKELEFNTDFNSVKYG